MLLVARAGRWRRRRGRCWGYVRDHHPILPNAVFKNINRYPIALDLYRTEVLALKGRAPYSVVSSTQISLDDFEWHSFGFRDKTKTKKRGQPMTERSREETS